MVNFVRLFLLGFPSSSKETTKQADPGSNPAEINLTEKLTCRLEIVFTCERVQINLTVFWGIGGFFLFVNFLNFPIVFWGGTEGLVLVVIIVAFGSVEIFCKAAKKHAS
jgi:hypothetical protein